MFLGPEEMRALRVGDPMDRPLAVPVGVTHGVLQSEDDPEGLRGRGRAMERVTS